MKSVFEIPGVDKQSKEKEPNWTLSPSSKRISAFAFEWTEMADFNPATRVFSLPVEVIWSAWQ
jgi:hypothetical protein